MSREPSYYEIALTQRQVVIAFVILLTCLVVAFFSGVWVGSGGRGAALGARQPETVAGLETGSDLPASATPGAEGGQRAPGKTADATDAPVEDGADRLRFFSERENPPVPPRETPPAPSGGAGAAPSRSTPSTDRPRSPGSSHGNLPRDDPSYDPRKDPRRRSDVAPAVRPDPEPPAPVDPRATEPPGAGGPVIQVFSSHDQAQAQTVLDRLLRAGLDAYLEAAEVSGVIRYRVRLGPFADRAQAEAVASQLRRDYKLDTWITQ